MNLRRWHAQKPVVESVGKVRVLRDDLLEGGSKLRFLPFLIGEAKEVVYGSPFCGGAALALSVLGREEKIQATLFYAKRGELHPRQRAVLRNGARVFAVDPGYMTNVQAKARRYAERAGALFLPLGFDVPAAVEPFVEFLSGVRKELGSPDQIWCAAGSGMLARSLGTAFPDSEICAVAVGLKSKHGAQQMPPNVRLLPCELRFEQESKASAPFPCDANYDRKAWAQLEAAKPKGSVLFYNVLGPSIG